MGFKEFRSGFKIKTRLQCGFVELFVYQESNTSNLLALDKCLVRQVNVWTLMRPGQDLFDGRRNP